MGPPSLLSNTDTRVRRPRREAGHSPLSSTEIKITHFLLHANTWLAEVNFPFIYGKRLTEKRVAPLWVFLQNLGALIRPCLE